MKCSFLILGGLLLTPFSLPAQTIDDFFDGSTLQEFRLTMAPADWQNLHDHYTDKKTNYRGDFTWRGITIQNVGVHTRGTGSLNPIKPGLGIEFSKFVSGQQFLTMDSLVLRNFSEDPTGLHERLTMQIFQRMGLPYLRTVHAKMYVNDQYVGLYQLVEPIDARYLKTHFGEADGYLYEALNGLNYHFDYLGDDPKTYVPAFFDPKTHADDPAAAAMRDMVRTLNQATDATFVSAMNPYLDLGAFVSYAAGEAFLAEIDGLLSVSGMANVYIYKRSADGRYFFMPWDKELTFTNSTWSIWAFTQDNVLLRRALAVPELRQRFLDTMRFGVEVIGGPGGWLDTEVEREYQQIRQAMLDDPNRVCVVNDVFVSCPAETFESAIGYLRYFPKERAAFVEKSLAEAGWTSPGSQTPVPEAGSVRNAASAANILAPGSLAVANVALPIFGERASSWPLPTQLAQISVSVAGVAAPLIQVSASGAWFQTPWDLPAGPASVTITASGFASAAVPIEIRPISPGIYAAAHANGNLVTDASPAQAGEWLVVWATGLGPSTGENVSGKPAPTAALVSLQNTVTATLGGETAEVVFAGLAPGYAGLQIMILRTPAISGINGAANLILTVGGEPGTPFRVPVH